MRTIGITGGIGSGKSELLAYIQGKYRCQVIRSDEAAHELEMPGNVCYKPLIDLLGNDILNDDGMINPHIMAQKIFSDKTLLEGVNGIVHPAVREYLLDKIKSSSLEKDDDGRERYDFLFIEAALLIEERYDLVLDELWYIYAECDVRRKRLKESRAYSDEKIDSIFDRQLSDEKFREKCKVVIDNSGTLLEAYRQIDEKLGEYLCQTK